MTLIWVALGGACGATLRFLVVRAFSGAAAGFPMGTLVVNVGGSFLIGLLAGSVFLDPKAAPSARMFFQTGLLGAFTTFSAFSLETMQLWQTGQIRSSLLNIGLNVCLCLAAVVAGMVLGSELQSRWR